MSKNDLTGQTFGCLTVMRDSGKRYRTHVIWECVDTDGNIHFVKTCNLKRKNAYLKAKKQFSRNKEKAHNKYEIRDGIVFVTMLNSENVMLCDCDDWNTLKSHNWLKSKNGYACASIDNMKSFFHNLIMERKDQMMVDHINGNKLDNRKANLRLVSRSVNAFNRHSKTRNQSGKVGVYRSGDKWRAEICVNGNKIFLGRYNLLQDAIEARKKAEVRYYGEHCAV